MYFYMCLFIFIYCYEFCIFINISIFYGKIAVQFMANALNIHWRTSDALRKATLQHLDLFSSPNLATYLATLEVTPPIVPYSLLLYLYYCTLYCTPYFTYSKVNSVVTQRVTSRIFSLKSINRSSLWITGSVYFHPSGNEDL